MSWDSVFRPLANLFEYITGAYSSGSNMVYFLIFRK